MDSREIRQKFLGFFQERGHKIIPSSSLIPENDPTVLFTTAGMQPLVPYLLGQKHPAGQRLVNVQKCFRTGDIDEIGDTYHHTFFEMMGNWSIGDQNLPDGIGENGYWKKEAINWSFEFLTSKQYLRIPLENIAVSVFKGDEDAPFDEESFNIWKGLGVPEQRIVKLPKKNNWWGQILGPCGPNTEMFVWTGRGKTPDVFDHEDERWIEVWNNVFMEFNRKIKARDENGEPVDFYFEPLAQKNVDTGMGLERIYRILNNYGDNYRADLFWPLIQKMEELSGKKYGETEKISRSMRIIADHIKASTFLIADGIVPSNTGRGYVLRRLLRRARYYYDSIGANDKNLSVLVEYIVPIYSDREEEYGLSKNKSKIQKVIAEEEGVFFGNLIFGRKLLDKIIANEKYISGDNAFLLYSTYGFPFELILDIAKENNIEVDIEGFKKKRSEHQELSRTASAGMFKGGLADTSEKTIKYHTAAHLMLEALRRVLGDHVSQKGSNITSERLRFDFSFDRKMTDDEIKKVEDLVNEKIKENLPVETKEMTLEEAKVAGATGVFDSKYGERVTVYSIGDFSKEICGGPHVSSTGEIGKFRIIKEESSSAGIRRIRAVVD